MRDISDDIVDPAACPPDSTQFYEKGLTALLPAMLLQAAAATCTHRDCEAVTKSIIYIHKLHGKMGVTRECLLVGTREAEAYVGVGVVQ